MADLQGGSQQSQGATPHDSADAGANPVKGGGVATAAVATSVDEGDIVHASYDLEGRARIRIAASDVTIDVEGPTPSGTADAGGKPVKGGGVAEDVGAAPPSVDDGDIVQAIFTRHGVQFVLGGDPNVQTERFNFTTAQVNTALITVGAGVRIVVTRASLLVGANATDTAIFARIGFGAVTTPTGLGVVAEHPGAPPGGGVIEGNGSGIIGIGAAGEDLRLNSDAVTVGSLSVLVSWFEIAG
jgi:hypothetical protein